MDLNYSAEELAFREEVRSWLNANLPQDLKDKVVRQAIFAIVDGDSTCSEAVESTTVCAEPPTEFALQQLLLPMRLHVLPVHQLRV